MVLKTESGIVRSKYVSTILPEKSEDKNSKQINTLPKLLENYDKCNKPWKW